VLVIFHILKQIPENGNVATSANIKKGPAEILWPLLVVDTLFPGLVSNFFCCNQTSPSTLLLVITNPQEAVSCIFIFLCLSRID